MDDHTALRRFVLEYLQEIQATLGEEDGVYRAVFPPGRKRRFGGERQFTFDPDLRRDHVELIEPGSPFVKLLLADAKEWGPVGVVATNRHPPRTLVYTFLLEAFSSVKKHTHFAWAALEPGRPDPVVERGLPPFLDEAHPASPADVDVAALKAGLERVVPAVERAGRSFAQVAVRESHEGYGKAMERVRQYVQGLRQDTYLDEAKIRKRLGEVQSKLYFTEDGLRELKLQREQERLTEELHAIRKRNMEATTGLQDEWKRHEETQRRRHEPKLQLRLVAATFTRSAEGAPAEQTNGHRP